MSGRVTLALETDRCGSVVSFGLWLDFLRGSRRGRQRYGIESLPLKACGAIEISGRKRAGRDAGGTEGRLAGIGLVYPKHGIGRICCNFKKTKGWNSFYPKQIGGVRVGVFAVFSWGFEWRFRAELGPFNRDVVRLKFAVSATKQWIGVVFNRNKNARAVVGILGFAGIFRVVSGI